MLDHEVPSNKLNRLKIPCGDDCNEYLELRVCKSNAGYYLGRWCQLCGPHSRQSGYYRTHEEARHAQIFDCATWRRDD